MTKVQLNRLMDLYNLLVTMRNTKTFDISMWKRTQHGVTTYCAAGKGVKLLPSWKKELKFTSRFRWQRDEGIEFKDASKQQSFDCPEEVLSRFLGLNTHQVFRIFIQSGSGWGVSTTPVDVSKRIEKVLTRKGYVIY